MANGLLFDGGNKYGPNFEEFWEKYPRKIAKATAHAAYLKAIRATPHAQIMEGLGRALISWMGKEEKYIPHASTWINQQRWTDESGGGGGGGGGDAVCKDRPTSALDSVERDWRFRLGLMPGCRKLYMPGAFWPDTWGERPEHGGRDIPPRVLREWQDRQKVT